MKTEAVASRVEEVVRSMLMAEVAHFEDDARHHPDEARGIAKARWPCRGVSVKLAKAEA